MAQNIDRIKVKNVLRVFLLNIYVSLSDIFHVIMLLTFSGFA